MREQDFYPKLCEIFSENLLEYLPRGSRIVYSYDKSLNIMVSEIQNKLESEDDDFGEYIPKLKIDILFGIKIPDRSKTRYILFEVKYLNQLNLSHLSQLVGYLQVTKNIKHGILLLVAKDYAGNQVSNDFKELIQMRYIPMDWKLTFSELEVSPTYSFKTGISWYLPGDGVEWENTADILGITSFEDLANQIIESSE